MVISQLLHGVTPTGEQTVPDGLFGCWRRNWITVGPDGDPDRSVSVIWLQTASGMGDLRIDPAQEPTETDSSCGVTVVDETTTPHMTADWLDGDTGFSQQPESSFPEKGWLVWDSPTIMRELAPSGAYVEEWQRLAGSDDVVAHFVANDAATTTNLYIAGRHVFLARRRGAGEQLDEYSYGVRSAGTESVTVELSTIVSHVGASMPLDHDWACVSLRP